MFYSSILRVGEGSSMMGIRVGVPHLTKFDVGGFNVGGGLNFDVGGCINP